MLKFGIIGLLLAAIAVPSVLFATQGQQATKARINAYKHEDGRIEFAMQVREGDGWSERILPTGRFLGTNAPTGKWLNSTPFAIPAQQSGPYLSIPIRDVSGVYQVPHTDTLVSFYSGEVTDSGGFGTILYVQAAAAASDDHNVEVDLGRTTLRLTCTGTEFYGSFVMNINYGENRYGALHYMKDIYDEEQGSWIAVRKYDYNFETGERITVEEDRWQSDYRLDMEDMKRLQQYDDMWVGYPHTGGGWTVAKFDLRVLFNTPVQANLDYCGEY